MNRAAAVILVGFSIACGSTSSSGSASPAGTPGSSATTSASSSPSAASAPSSSPTPALGTFDILPPADGPPPDAPQITCSGAIGPTDPVAVVALHSGIVVMRDYADPSHPRSACVFIGGTNSIAGVQLIDARHVVVPRNGPDYLYAVVDLPEVRYHWFQLPHPANELPTFLAVSPARDQLAWWSADIPGNTDKVHLTTRAGDQVVASLPDPHGGRCGGADDSMFAGYTHSGSHLFVLDNENPSGTSLLVLQGAQTKLLVSPPSPHWPVGAQPAMAVWAPKAETLYYRQQGDAWTWTPAAGAKRYLSGVPWQYPTMSADGRYLAYALPRPDGTHNVYLIDLTHGATPVLIGKGPRTVPVFLNSTLLWFKSEAQGICGPGGNQPLIYDVTDGTETGSVIDQPYAVWPATSSNF